MQAISSTRLWKLVDKKKRVVNSVHLKNTWVWKAKTLSNVKGIGLIFILIHVVYSKLRVTWHNSCNLKNYYNKKSLIALY